jgi:hypothetical protein
MLFELSFSHIVFAFKETTPSVYSPKPILKSYKEHGLICNFFEKNMTISPEILTSSVTVFENKF